jgi:hypothetical protein
MSYNRYIAEANRDRVKEYRAKLQKFLETKK